MYRDRVTEQSRLVEKHWLGADHNTASATEEVRQLAELTTLGTMFSRIESMRVVPFDLRSFGQLIGSSFASVTLILPVLHVNRDISGIFDAMGKLLGHLGGH